MRIVLEGEATLEGGTRVVAEVDHGVDGGAQTRLGEGEPLNGHSRSRLYYIRLSAS
jgi:hypothetical protein